jgi:hypothetical protein
MTPTTPTQRRSRRQRKSLVCRSGPTSAYRAAFGGFFAGLLVTASVTVFAWGIAATYSGIPGPDEKVTFRWSVAVVCIFIGVVCATRNGLGEFERQLEKLEDR